MKFDVKSAFNSMKASFVQNRPAIMTGTGIVLMITGSALAVMATVKTMNKTADMKAEKLNDILADPSEYENLSDEDQEKYDEIVASPIPVKEAVPEVYKYWILPLLAQSAGVIFLLLAQKENTDRLSSMATALAYYIADSKDTKAAARELLGDEKADEIEERAAEQHVSRNRSEDGLTNVFDTGTGSQLYLDYYTKRWVKASPAFIDSCLNELNMRINDIRYGRGCYYGVDDCYVKLNEYYSILGLDMTGLGEEFGFNVNDGLVEYCQFSGDINITDQGFTYKVIRFRNGPNYIPYSI